MPLHLAGAPSMEPPNSERAIGTPAPMPRPLTYLEYPNAERFARYFGRSSLYGLPILIGGIVLAITTNGAPMAVGVGAAVFGLWWFVVFQLAERRTLRKLEQLREQAAARPATAGDSP